MTASLKLTIGHQGSSLVKQLLQMHPFLVPVKGLNPEISTSVGTTATAAKWRRSRIHWISVEIQHITLGEAQKCCEWHKISEDNAL